MIYLDSSALTKRYLDEPGSDVASGFLHADPAWITGQHTFVEVALALARRLDEAGERVALGQLEADWQRLHVVAIDDIVAHSAARIGALTGTRTLDALQLACADRAGGRSIPIVTFDLRLAQAARSIGFTVLGS